MFFIVHFISRVTSTSSSDGGGGKYNSTERKKGQMRVNNSGNDIESRIDSTRVNTEDLIRDLVATNLAQTCEDVGEDNEPEECGLQLYVGKDGTATLGSRSGTNQRKNKALPKITSHSTQHQNNHQPPQSLIQSSSNRIDTKEEQETDLLLMQPEPSSQKGSRQSLHDARCGE